MITWESTFQPAFTPVVHCWSRPQSRAFSNGAERWTSYFRRPLHKPCLEGTTCTSISGTCALQTPWALHFRKCRPSSSLITILDLPCLRTLHLDCSSLVIIYCNYIFSTCRHPLLPFCPSHWQQPFQIAIDLHSSERLRINRRAVRISTKLQAPTWAIQNRGDRLFSWARKLTCRA